MQGNGRWWVAGLVAWTMSATAVAQDDAEVDVILGEDVQEIEELALEDLLTMETDVAASVHTEVREAPGIITVITHEEIVRMGARDLIDVLRQVPGLYFGSDVEGAVGVGFRGHWGHEGKMLLIIDGQEVNELLYSTLQFGNHYPVDHIERIEVVRGPGSVLYGGYAELAVIRITTRSGADLQGFEGSLTYGQMWSSDLDDYGRRNLSLQYGRESEDVPGLRYSLAGFIGQGRRGRGPYTDFYGDRFSISENRQDPMFFNLGVQYQDLSARLIVDYYRATTRDAFDAILPRPADLSFLSVLAGLKYTLSVTDEITVTPSFNFTHQSPWRLTERDVGGVDTNAIGLYYRRTIQRYRGQVLASWEAHEYATATVGLQAYTDQVPDVEDENPDFQIPGASYSNFAAFAEIASANPIVNATAGLRVESHSKYGASVVPRIGLTRVFGDFHMKGLFAMAFRAPGIENIDLNADIEPERTYALELEAGYRISEAMSLTVNLYDLTIRRPIIYNYDEVTDAESYLNYDRVGTRGIDAEYRLRQEWGYANLTYSYYQVGSLLSDRDDVPEPYAVPGSSRALLGAPRHQVAFHVGLIPVEHLSIGPSAIVTSGRWGYLTADAAGDPVAEKTSATVLFNLWVQYGFDEWVKGLYAGAGVFNLFDDEDPFVQPYNGYRPPIPGPGREVVIRVGYGAALD